MRPVDDECHCLIECIVGKKNDPIYLPVLVVEIVHLQPVVMWENLKCLYAPQIPQLLSLLADIYRNSFLTETD